MVDTYVKGLMSLTRAVWPGMVARNHSHIVNIGSTAAIHPCSGGNVDGATKAFVRRCNVTELMPVSQAFGPLVVRRGIVSV